MEKVADPSAPVSGWRDGLLCADVEVPLVTGGTVGYVNLDNAGSTSAFVAAKQALDELLPWYSSVHRGAGFASIVCTEVYRSARETVRRFVGAREDDIAIFTRNTTDALNLLAAALPEATAVITFTTEHHANLLPWRRGSVRHLAVPENPEAAVRSVDRALAGAPTGPRLVAVTGASNVSGELWPVAEIAEVAHRHGARLALDAAQLAPHRPIDMAALGVDYVAFSGHKLYAPFGAGVLVGRRDWLDAGRPYLAGGGAVVSVTADDVDWHVGPARHEAGTPAVIGAAGLAAACREIERIGWPAVIEHERELSALLTTGLAEIEGIVTYAIWPSVGERIAVVCFNLAGLEAAHLAAILSAEYGIGVRHGLFCAHPLMRELSAETGGHAVRASIGIGTRRADIERLLLALERVAAQGARWSYTRVGMEVFPDPDPRPWPELAGLLS
jgi:selenocysteine lyase/cysteine desulfurase